jgi:hypothetical protein
MSGFLAAVGIIGFALMPLVVIPGAVGVLIALYVGRRRLARILFVIMIVAVAVPFLSVLLSSIPV